jgi:acyl transferase domain-containing protein/acyl carrier protein
LLQPHLGCDVRQAIFGLGATDEELRQTWLAQPALFTLEYALACLLMSWGIAPAAMIGHSIGEYVAACLSGVFSLEDALAIVAVRGKLMQQTESGAMVATDLPEREVRQLLPAGVDVAAVNGPAQTVLSGREPDIARLEELLLARGASSVRLRTSHAFHSATMDPILDEFRAQLQVVKLRPPTVPYISNLTGTWQTARAAVADYWVEHLRQSVKFGDGCHELVRNGHLTFVEVGPGPALSKLAQQFLRATPNGTAFHVGLTQNSLADGLGKLWTCGVPISWPKYFSGERRCRVPLPPYPFEWQRYDIEPAAASPAVPALTKNPNPMMWFYLPAWRQTRPQLNVPDSGSYLFFLDPSGLGTSVAESLGPAGTRLILVEPGEAFHQMDERSFRIRPEEPGDYLTLFEALRQAGTLPEQILHFWNVDSRPSAPGKGFYSLLHLAQALAMTSQPMRVNVISTGVHSVIGNEAIDALKATLLGPCRVAPHEQPSIYWRNIDVEWPGTDATRQVIGECAADSLEPVVAYRASTRWTETIEPAPLPPNSRHGSLLRSGGTYLITGGMGGIGLTIAEYLAREYRARLALVGRSPLAEDSPKRQKLAALESDGAEVLTFAADVADMEQMRQVLNQVQERFGALNGVIHSAGIAGGGMIQIKERTVAQAVLSPKVEGTLTLDALLRDVKLDFFAVFSSLTALLGGFGQVDYCAANSFLDAYARSQKARRDRVTVSINWDAWDEVGMAVNTALPAEMEAHRAQVLKDAIHPKEGAEVFHWALESGLPTISVSTVYLPWRVEQSRIAMWAQIGSSAAPPTPSMAERHPRPQIRTDFIPPETEMENMIAKIWQDLLGLEQVGVRDNFLELGGHSLLATQMASRMRSSLGVEISVRKIFELPTIAELAKMVDTTMTESDEVSRMIAMVEQMSEEQVKTELERTE